MFVWLSTRRSCSQLNRLWLKLKGPLTALPDLIVCKHVLRWRTLHVMHTHLLPIFRFPSRNCRRRSRPLRTTYKALTSPLLTKSKLEWKLPIILPPSHIYGGYGLESSSYQILNVNCSPLESAPVSVIIYKRLQVSASCLDHFFTQMGSLLSNLVCRSGLYITRRVCDSYTIA